MRSGTEPYHDVLDEDDTVPIRVGALLHRHPNDGRVPALGLVGTIGERFAGRLAATISRQNCSSPEIDRIAMFAVRSEDRCTRHVRIVLRKAAASEGGHGKGSSLLPGARTFYWMIAHRDSCSAARRTDEGRVQFRGIAFGGMESEFLKDKKLSRRTLLAQGYRIDARYIGRGRRSALDDVRGLGRPDLCGQKRLCLRPRRSKHKAKGKCCEHSRLTTWHKPHSVLKHVMLTQETSLKERA